MSAVDSNNARCLRISCAVLGIVAGSIIIGISSSYGAAAIGGVFLGAAGLALFITVYPNLKSWFDFFHHQIILGAPRIHPQPITANANVQTAPIMDGGTHNVVSNSMLIPNMIPDKQQPDSMPSDEGPSSGVPDLIAEAPIKQLSQS